jgi:hypothetical protein
MCLEDASVERGRSRGSAKVPERFDDRRFERAQGRHRGALRREADGIEGTQCGAFAGQAAGSFGHAVVSLGRRWNCSVTWYSESGELHIVS